MVISADAQMAVFVLQDVLVPVLFSLVSHRQLAIYKGLFDFHLYPSFPLCLRYQYLLKQIRRTRDSISYPDNLIN